MSTGLVAQEERLIAVLEGNPETVASTASGLVTDDQPDAAPVPPNVLECIICMRHPTDPVSTSCGHVFCWPCIYQWLQYRPRPCPICRHILRRDLDIIPLFGADAGPSHGSGSGAAKTPESDIIIPPRPRNPLLGMASPSTGGSRRDHFLKISRGSVPNSVLTACNMFMHQLSDALDRERGKVRRLMEAQVNWELDLRRSESRNADLRQLVYQRDRRISLLRNRRLEVEINLKQKILELVRDLEESQAREGLHIEMQNQMSEYVATLQQQLDRANGQLPSGWSGRL